jgi:hypothetical protein
LQSTQKPSTTSTNQYHLNFSFDVSQLWGQVIATAAVAFGSINQSSLTDKEVS